MELIRRKVKGRAYFYLERTLRLGERRWKKVYLYVGAKKASVGQMKALRRKLERKVRDYIRREILRPGTKFIDASTAIRLERIKNTHAELIGRMGSEARSAWVKRQRMQFITNTNAIEGSRITLDQTKRILGLRKTYEADKDELEILNMRDCLAIYDKWLEKGMEMDERTVLAMHLALLKAIRGYEGHGGAWRNVNVFIRTSKYQFSHWKTVPASMAGLFRWYAANKERVHPVELAAQFHAKLVTVHPFADGNGRIARLLMNYILQLNGFPFVDIPYEKRDEYFETQERSHFGDFRPFVWFLVKQIIEDYKKMKRKR